MSNSIIYQVEDGSIARITLDRPEILNSFNRTMARELLDALGRAGEDASVRVLLIGGNGRAFCAGQDLEDANPLSDPPPPPLGEIVEASYTPLIRAIVGLEKPIVCAVNGVAAGAGANLALACDLVLASTKAVFVQSFCKIGLTLDTGGSYFLPRLVGLARARSLALLGESLSAEKAEEWGLIHKACPPEDLESEAIGLCRRLAAGPTKGLGLIKRALNRSLANDLESQLELERDLQTQAGNSHDFREGVRAFLDKRPPQFKGR